MSDALKQEYDDAFHLVEQAYEAEKVDAYADAKCLIFYTVLSS